MHAPPPKIPVILAPALAADGATSMDLYLANIRAALEPFTDRFDFEVAVPPSTPRGSWADKQWQRYFGYPRLLARRLRARPGAVLHVLDQSYGHLCRRDVPTLVSCHGLENFRLPLARVWQQKLWLYRVRSMRRARRVAAISTDLVAGTRDLVGVPAERIFLNHYGVDAEFTPQGPLEPRLRARREAGELLVAHTGTNIARKNIARLLDAVARLRAGGLPVCFVKAGANPREDGYRDQMERLGLLGHFEYLGWRDAHGIAAIYRTCHALAFPSIFEGFGRPILEAQACGLPVVTADTDSAHEVAGQAALFHVPTDADDLAAKLRAVLTEEETRRRLVATGFENTRRFSWAEHARVLAETYAELHGSSSPPHA